MKNIKHFIDFVNEKIESQFIIHIDNKRLTPGSLKEIESTYDISIAVNDDGSYDFFGTKLNLENFIEDYSIVGKLEPI